jgi:uncharacterized protein YjeT (DUF2065 family)
MDISLVVAKVLGVYFIISSLFLMFRGKTVPHLLKDFFDHPAIVYLTGAILIFLSTVFLIQSNVWDGTWRTLITIIMWATFLKGVGYILAPEALRRMVTKKTLGSLNLYGLIALVGGVFLLYLA